jgi:hypothetical protein
MVWRKRSLSVLREQNWIEVRRIGPTGTACAYIVNDRVAWAGIRLYKAREQARRVVAFGGGALAWRAVILAQFEQGGLCGLRRRLGAAEFDQVAPQIAAAVCVSAWKKDPVGGVIGIQKGPLW